MDIFCGKKCKCKNRCEADLRAMGKDVLKGCYAACKTKNPPANGYHYLESLPDQSRILIETDPFIEAQFQEQFLAQDEEGINPILFVALAIALGLIIIYLRKK